MKSSDFDWKRVRGQQAMQVLLQLMLVIIWHLATLGKVMPFARNFVRGQQKCYSGCGSIQVCPKGTLLKAVFHLQLGYVD